MCPKCDEKRCIRTSRKAGDRFTGVKERYLCLGCGFVLKIKGK